MGCGWNGETKNTQNVMQIANLYIQNILDYEDESIIYRLYILIVSNTKHTHLHVSRWWRRGDRFWIILCAYDGCGGGGITLSLGFIWLVSQLYNTATQEQVVCVILLVSPLFLLFYGNIKVIYQQSVSFRIKPMDDDVCAYVCWAPF